jgi:hypothetical protein
MEIYTDEYIRTIRIKVNLTFLSKHTRSRVICSESGFGESSQRELDTVCVVS